MEKIANIAGLIVVVAGVYVLVASKNSAGVIKSIGQAFQGSIQAATGQKVSK